jgi:hypothetical protein
MNRKNLTAAVLAGLAGVAGIVGSAQAVNINPDGLGQVLIYPYYTTNGGNLTILSVVNTSEDAKAVKVRFLEGENSREVLDFNLYMSEFDVWTAALVDLEGTPTMITTDTTCTVPYIYGNGGVQEFLPWALDDAEYLDRNYKGKQTKEYGDISRAMEGHFEMIEMGTLVDSEVENDEWVDIENYPFCEVGSTEVYGNPSSLCEIGLDRAWTEAELKEKAMLTPYGSASAATHDEGVPEDCDQLVDAWTTGATSKTDGYWIKTKGAADMEAPSGGLFGGAAIVNVTAGTMYSYDAKAVDGFARSVDAEDYLHAQPGSFLPSLDSGDRTDAYVFVNGDTLTAGSILGTSSLERGVDAVSFVFMHDQIMNEYTTEVGPGASTEWVLTFPTKQFYVHQDFLDYYDEEFRGDNGNQPDAPVAPFTSTWTWVNTVWDKDASGNYIPVAKVPGYVDYPCEVVTLDSIWDREEGTIVPGKAPPGTPIPPIVSPAPPPTDEPDPDGLIPFELCYETSVIAFGEYDEDVTETAILGSRNFHNIDNEALGFEYGWARLQLDYYAYDRNENGVIDSSIVDEDEDASGNCVWDNCVPEDELYRDNLGGLRGLPVTGFAVMSFQNSFLGDGADVMANYGGIFQHKATRLMGSDWQPEKAPTQ